MRKIFNVWDAKVECYLDPMAAMNKGEALRIIERMTSNPEHIFSKSPQDFTLFEIGEYDEYTGVMKPYETKITVAGLWELKNEEKQENVRAI